MYTLTNNSTRDYDLTHENPIPKAEVAKPTDINSNATSMSISADTENGAELDSNVTDFKCVSPISSNDSGMSISDSKDTNSISSTKKERSNNDSPFSMRTDKKLIHEIKDLLKDSCFITLGESQIVQLTVEFVSKSHKDDLKKILTEVKNLQDEKDYIVTFRIPYGLENEIIKICNTNNFTFAINCCLVRFKHHLLDIKSLSMCKKNSSILCEQESLKPNEYLFSRFGLKKGDLLDMITRSIEEIRSKSKCTTYFEPFTGTANVLLHLKKFDFEEINDKDEGIINLLLVIQNFFNEFILELLHYTVKDELFYEFKKDIDNREGNNEKNKIKCARKVNGKKDKIEYAVETFYTILLSLRGKGQTFNENATNKTLYKKINIIFNISQRLKNTKITKTDAFYFLNKIAMRGESLEEIIIYIDAPYIGTEKVYKTPQKINIVSFHKKLSKHIFDLKEKGAKIIISYRATVTNSNNETNTKEVQKLLDDLYMNQGFYIQFMIVHHHTKKGEEYVPDDQIEILLTSEEVEGSVPYNIKIANLIEIWKLENILFDVKNKAVFLEKDGTAAPIYNEQGDILTLNEIQDILDRLYINKKYFISITGTETLKISLSKKRVKDSVPYDCNIADLIKKHVK